MGASYQLGLWIVPVPMAAAIVGAISALLFALFKSFLDRRRLLIDLVRMLVAELENLERHTNDSFQILRGTGRSGYGGERLTITQFLDGGLVTLKVRDLLGLPTRLIRDLMVLVVFLRNFNTLADILKNKEEDTAFDAQLDVLRARLMIAQKWAGDIRSSVKQNLLTGTVGYPKKTQTPTRADGRSD